MNCLELRRDKLADPRRLSPESEAHGKSCPACAAFAREVDESESALDRALMAPVPEGLAERVLLHAHRPRRGWRLWALAASMLLAVALGFLAVRETPRSDDEYARIAIEHVVMEPEAHSVIRDADPEAFRRVVQNLGGAVKDMPGTIRYMRLCPYGEGFAWHIVFETAEGLATLFLVPESTRPAAQTAAVGGWSAAVEPTARGYYAIVTASADATSRFVKVLRDCIVWNS
jgi:hypothetical protein